MTWWMRMLGYVGCAIVPGLLVFGLKVSTWPTDAVVMTIAFGLTIAALCELAIWAVEMRR